MVSEKNIFYERSLFLAEMLHDQKKSAKNKQKSVDGVFFLCKMIALFVCVGSYTILHGCKKNAIFG